MRPKRLHTGAKRRALVHTSYHDRRQRTPPCFQDRRAGEAHRQSTRSCRPTKERGESRPRMPVPRRTCSQHVMGDRTVLEDPFDGVTEKEQIFGVEPCGMLAGFPFGGTDC